MTSTLESKKHSPRSIKRATIVTHGKAPTIGPALARVERVAREHGVKLIFPQEEREKHGLENGGADPRGADIAVVLGGDGTMLRALHTFLGTDVPVIGVNFGRVGFLASIQPDQLESRLARVFEGGFTHVLMLDADMQHRPEEAGRLLEAAARDGVDAVLGERQFDRDRTPAPRYHANRIGSAILARFVGAPVRDTQCGYRVFRVDALRGLELMSTGYEIETEMLIKVLRRGGRATGVPVTAVYAGETSKLRPVRDTSRTCFLAVYYRFLERI